MHKTDLIQTWTESVCGIMEFNGMEWDGIGGERMGWEYRGRMLWQSSWVEGSIRAVVVLVVAAVAATVGMWK